MTTPKNEPLEERLLNESGEFIRKELDKHGNFDLAVQDLVLYTIAEFRKAAVSAIEDEMENFAAMEHERWAKWQAYLHSKLYQIDDHRVSMNHHLKILPTELYDRWERQIATLYKDLSEAEKESDRKEVQPYLTKMKQTLTAITAVEGVGKKGITKNKE